MNELERAAREAYGNGFDEHYDDPDYVDYDYDPNENDPNEKKWEEYCEQLEKEKEIDHA